MSMKKRLTGWSILLAIVVTLTTISSLAVLAKSGDEGQPVETAKAVEVVMNDDSFNPKEITIPSGTATTLILKNKGVKPHTFTVAKLGIDVEVQPGKETSITVKPQQPGTYELICRYHAQEGMVGKVIVQ